MQGLLEMPDGRTVAFGDARVAPDQPPHRVVEQVEAGDQGELDRQTGPAGRAGPARESARGYLAGGHAVASARRVTWGTPRWAHNQAATPASTASTSRRA